MKFQKKKFKKFWPGFEPTNLRYLGKRLGNHLPGVGTHTRAEISRNIWKPKTKGKQERKCKSDDRDSRFSKLKKRFLKSYEDENRRGFVINWLTSRRTNINNFSFLHRVNHIKRMISDYLGQNHFVPLI